MQTRPFYAHAQPTRPFLGGKSARVARLSAMERRVFPMASHVGSTPSTTGNWVECYNENLGSLGTQMILTRLIPGQGCRYSPADVHGSMPHLSQPCMYRGVRHGPSRRTRFPDFCDFQLISRLRCDFQLISRLVTLISRGFLKCACAKGLLRMLRQKGGVSRYFSRISDFLISTGS